MTGELGVYVKRSDGLVALVPSGPVTVTSTVPVPDGATTLIVVADLEGFFSATGVAPKSTVVTPVSRSPPIATFVPPTFVPSSGVTLSTLGGPVDRSGLAAGAATRRRPVLEADAIPIPSIDNTTAPTNPTRPTRRIPDPHKVVNRFPDRTSMSHMDQGGDVA